MDSLELFKSAEKFDLIWVDGDHSNPVVMFDIYNSFKLLDDKGVGVCDCMRIIGNRLPNSQNSLAALDALNYLKINGLIGYLFVPKRLGFHYNYSNSERKYLGVF